MSGATASAQDFVDSHRHDEGGDALFGIAEIADEFGISTRTIRFYESKGLLSPRRINGARVLNRRDRARLTLILRAKAIGSSLAAIKQYLDLYGAHGEGRAGQLKFVVERTAAAIEELEARRENIETTLAELRVINRTSRRQLAALKPK
jgi:DNA-binding transcriptional MerR regulator